MTEDAENISENEALPDVVAPMTDEDEPPAESSSQSTAELEELEHGDRSGTAHAKPEV